MQSIFDAITEWLKGLLVEGIMGNLGGLFTNVNEQVGEIAAQVGTTPAAWNAGVFSMIRQLSETVILPIAGLVLTFVMTYERDTHADQQDQAIAMKQIRSGKDSREKRSEAGTRSKRNALAERNPQITHTQPEGQAADPPQDSVNNGSRSSAGTPQFQEAATVGNGKLRSQEREDEPGKNALHQPETFPTPILDFIDRNVGTALPEAADCDYD